MGCADTFPKKLLKIKATNLSKMKIIFISFTKRAKTITLPKAVIVLVPIVLVPIFLY